MLPWTFKLEEQIEGEKPVHIFQRLQKSFSKACISYTAFYSWVSQFRARWVPKQLTEDQKASRVTIAKEHLGDFYNDENKVFELYFTGDEMWVHYAEPKTKAQSKLWKWFGSPLSKKFKLSPSADKVMLVAFWDLHGIILAHIMPKCWAVIARYYSEVILKKTQRTIEKVAPQASPENVLHLHDSAPSHTASSTAEHQFLQVAIVVPPSI